MRKFIIPLMLAASMAGFVACTPEKELRSALEAGGIITANAGDVEDELETKTTMVYKFDITWKSGDKIYVQDNNGNYDNYVLKSGAGTTRAAFQKANEEWCKGKPSGDAWAFYPAEWYSNGTYDWPSVQTTSSTMPMYAETTLDACQNGDIEFQSIGSVFQIVFTSLTPGKTLKSIRVEDASKAMSGRCTLSASREFQFSDTHGAITLDLGDGTSLGTTAKYFNIILPPGKYTDVTVTFTATDGAQCRKNSKSFPTMKKATVHKIAMSGEFTHEAVQLWEDGPFWATTNIGASSPEEYGLYFQWGNVTGYTPSGTTFSYSFDESSYTGTSGSLLSGDIPKNAEYDAAQALWGSDWMIPANADFQGLINNCDISWEDTGILFTGKGSYSDRSIFLPAAGVGYRTSLNGVGVYSYYWSGSGKDYDSGNASNLFFNVYTKTINAIGYPRYYGMAIRPVKCDPPGPVTDITLNRDYLELEPNDTFTLTATVLPANASNKEVIWTSNNMTVATVDNTGMVVAKSAGSATISVISKDGGHIATCTVTVREEGALPGKFSVGAGKQVQFSRGNLQATYDRIDYNWGFAVNQYDYVGASYGNTTIDRPISGDVVDLFGFPTATCGFGISTSTVQADYVGFFTDWGMLIGDGGTWRTLSHSEWEYLYKTRDRAINLRQNGVTVCGRTNCLIFAPDGYTGSIASSYDASTWPAAEAAGLICLPAAGYRMASDISKVGAEGFYWTSTCYQMLMPFILQFDDSSLNPRLPYPNLFNGLSVRLVTDVK